MSSPLPDAEINGAREDVDVTDGKRDVKNHMLFEVSTEAANRGSDEWEGLPFGRR